MVHFINTAEKYLITTNYKVWFSTLTAHTSLYKTVDSRKSGYRHYLFVRNPYERLESFYKDKLFHTPRHAVFFEGHKWQNCQQIFLDKSGESGWSFEEQQKYLLSLSFEKFIQLLSDVIRLDVHLMPQTFPLRANPQSVSLNIEFDKILKVEDQESIAFIKNELKIDTSLKKNSTKEFKIDLNWTPDMRKTVNRLYIKDFIYLAYAMKS